MEQTETKPTVYVGMNLYRSVTSRYYPIEIREYTVSKIGRVYFEVNELPRDRFEISTLRRYDKNFSQNCFQLYRTKEEILDRIEKQTLQAKVRKFFYDNSPISLNQLREINNIIESK